LRSVRAWLGAAVAAAVLVPAVVPAGDARDAGVAADVQPAADTGEGGRRDPVGSAAAGIAAAVEPVAASAAGPGAVVPTTDYGADEFAGPAYDDWMLGSPFRLVPRARATRVPYFPRGIPAEGGFPGRRLLLTFDDGPWPEATPLMLAILAREHVPAVFFLVGGRVEDRLERRQGRRVARAIVEGGHAVGNHTQAHPRLPTLTEKLWKEQIVLAHDAIRSAVGYAPTLFRAPYGKVNAAIDRYLTYRGYTRVHWTYVADEFRGKSAGVMVRGLLEQIRERERQGRNVGGIVLLHESHERSVEATELFIRRMKAENCALLAAGDEDVWRFVDFSAFYEPVGASAAEGAAPALRASAEETATARRWCDEHAAELEEIRSIDAIEVDIEDEGFGRVDGYTPPPVEDAPAP
jgi:peptidoglycan/xylan/chitin deacetylase (PgdA/CDA1 family)